MNPADPFGLIGQVLDGQFRVDKFVGEGGFSIVYRGHHAGLDEPIAIKCLKLPQALGSALVESFVRRFRDESRIHYRLSQGNLAIARSIASGTTISSTTSALVPYMVLEWLEGRSVAQDFEVRRQQGKTGRSLDEVVKLFDPAAQGLAFAHAQGVVHRDMNPGNLFMIETRQGVMTKVLDFGVAKVVSDHALELGPRAPTLGQIRIFAPAYGAPEQFDDGMGKVGPASDVYSFALILLEALRDLAVRDGEHLGEFAMAALDENARPTPRALGIPVGDAVEEVFARAVALRPADRPTDMGEMWGGLKHALQMDAQSGKLPHAGQAPARAGTPWKPHAPAAGQAAPDRPVTADMRAPVVEVSRPGSVAPPPVNANASQMFRGTVRMSASSSSTPPPPVTGSSALAATPLNSTLMMDQGRRLTPLPQTTRTGQAPLNSTLQMASPYAQSQNVPQYGGPAASPVPPPPAPVDTAAATVALNDGNGAFAAARAMADAANAAKSAPPMLRSEVPTVVPPPPKSNTKMIALVVVFAVLATAGGFFGYRAMQAKNAPSPTPGPTAAVVTPPPAATPVAATAAPAPPPPAPTPPPPAPTTVAMPTVPNAPPRAASPSAPQPPSGHAATPSPSPAPAPVAQPSPATPVAPPAGAHAFDPKAARASLDVLNGVLASCRSPGGRTGDGSITVSFTPDGHAERAMIDEPPYAGTPEGACVSSRFKQAKMAPFEGAPGSVVYTFHIPN